MNWKRFNTIWPASLLLLLFVTSFPVYSQIEENLKRYTGDNAEGYMKPIVSGLGVNMNRGWYQSAKIPVVGLRLRVGFVAMIAPIPDDDKTFMAKTEGNFSPQQTAEASTVVGSEEAALVTGTGGAIYAFPGGLNMNATAFAVPQLTVGILGSEAILRYFKADFGDSEIGSISLKGIGIRHSISQYLFMFPIDISVGAFWQDVDVDEDLINMTTLHYGVQASRGFGPLTLFGGVGFDNTSASVNYTYENQSTGATMPVELDVDGDTGMEITAGLGLNLVFIHLSADASFGARTAFALNAAIGL